MPNHLCSRAEAQNWLKWGESNPEVMEAYWNETHPAHGEVQDYAVWLNYLAHDHPQADDGSPVPLSEVSGEALEAVLGYVPAIAEDAPVEPSYESGSGFAAIAAMSPEDARAKIAEIMDDPDRAALLIDHRNEDFDLIRAEWDALHEAAYPSDIESETDFSTNLSPDDLSLDPPDGDEGEVIDIDNPMLEGGEFNG